MKRNRIEFLFIDFDAPAGHVGFNRIWLRSLCREEEVTVTTVMPADFIDRIMSDSDLPCIKNIALPKCLCKRSLQGLPWRIFSIFRLLWIRIHVRLRSYDYVLITSFDTISFFFGSLFMRKRCCLVCHNNIKQVAEHRMADFCFRRLSGKHQIIVLEDYIKTFLEERNISHNAVVVHHGCPQPFGEDSCRAVPRWFDDLRKKYKKIIFSPSATSTGSFWNDFLKDPDFVRFLDRSDSVFVVRTSADYPVRKGFFPVKNRLSDAEYAAVFSASDAILIAYPSSFVYRTSAVLYEAIANRKELLVYSNPAMIPYRAIVGEDVFFDDTVGLCAILNGISKNNQEMTRFIPEEVKTPRIYSGIMKGFEQ